MTDVDRRIWLPHDNAKFLEWYEGIFDSVFIALHPFSRVGELDPELAAYRTNVFSRSETTIEQGMELAAARTAQAQYDRRSVLFMQKKIGEPVPWASVCHACGFQSFKKLNQALLTTIQALRAEYSDQARADELENYCRRQKLFLPTEDCIHILLEQSIAHLLQDLRCSDVFIADEFHEKIREISVGALMTSAPWFVGGTIDFRAVTIYPADHTFLIGAAFDQFYTAICGNRQHLESVGIADRFEGFWCDPDTRPGWWRSEEGTRQPQEYFGIE